MDIFQDGISELSLVEILGNDMRVVQAARVSYNCESKGAEKDEALIKFLLQEGHLGPFEHVVITMKVTAPIFVIRQWFRHRTWSYNEISRRYTSSDINFYIPKRIGVQDVKNKQKVIDYDNAAFSFVVSDKIRKHSAISLDLYYELLEAGVPRETARVVLPQNLYSSFYATVDLRNLLGFIKERSAENAQYEIREYAKAILQLITPHIPWSIEAWKEINGY
jgi:thymidylate synthase (FAD)